MSDRTQLVDLSGTNSLAAPITCGVPQGSILGPLLFLIYVNDMPDVIRNKLLLYAEDSGILVSGKNRQDVETLLSEDLHSLSQWLIDNKLSLHLGKTETILFGSTHKLKPCSELDVSCTGKDINSPKTVKYLGVTIDQTLSFDSMAQAILKKINAKLKFLYRNKQFLTQSTKKLLVMSLIQCHFDYGSCIWYNSITKTMKNKLQTTQNKLVRFILDLDSRHHVGKE